MSRRDTLIDWLNDAYATEQNQIQVLQSHVKDAEDQPAIRSRLESHLAETRRHAEMVDQCIQDLGGSTSTTKSVMGKISGMFAGAGTGAADDEMVKNCLADYSMEHFEIACYRGLITAAEALGEGRVADTCRRILRDEEQMAAWLQEQVPTVVEGYIVRQAA
jgi:ferritin-like metal-binding protein YciE